MKKIFMFVAVVGYAAVAVAATAAWTGVACKGWSESADPMTTISDLGGIVRADDGVGATISGMIFVRTTENETHIKSYDYSYVAAPLNTIWLLALYGDVLDANTLSSFKQVELSQYSDCGVGGDKIADPSNFYLAFVAENWDDYVAGVENPHIWYGWVNVGVNADGALDVFSSGIDLYGGAVRIGEGGIPEPSSFVLMLFGIACVGLSRRNISNVPR